MSDKNDVELRTSLLGCEGAVIVEVTPADAVALFEKISAELKRLRAENSTLTAERDEARRELCRIESAASGDPNMTSRAVAADLGWDCFKEDGR